MSDSPEFGKFPTTRPSLIENAIGGSQTKLTLLMELYQPPLRSHLVFRMRIDRDAANDYLQGFITDKILSGDLLAHYQKDRGRFRSFLCASLTRYAIDKRRKKSPTLGTIEFETLPDAGNDDIFTVAWAKSILLETLDRLRSECLQRNQLGHWKVFEARLLTPICNGLPPATYDAIYRECGFQTVSQARNAWMTMSRKNGKYERLLREVIVDATPNHDVEEEIRELSAALTSIACVDLSQELREYLDVDPAGSSSQVASTGPMELGHLISPNEGHPNRFRSTFADSLRKILRTNAVDDNVGCITHDDILTNPAEQLELLKSVGMSFKDAAHGSFSSEVSLFMYYAFIAAALVGANESISSMSDAALIDAFQWAVERPGIDEQLKTTFDQAIASVEQRT